MSQISLGKFEDDRFVWQNFDWKSANQHATIKSRQQHTAVAFRDKTYIFGGCYSYNRKRNVRECSNQLLEFDKCRQEIDILKTAGISVGPRKNHCAAVYKHSMVVFGGQLENGSVLQEIVVFQFEELEWVKLKYSGKPEFGSQAAMCSVIAKNNQHSFVRKVRSSFTVERFDSRRGLHLRGLQERGATVRKQTQVLEGLYCGQQDRFG